MKKILLICSTLVVLSSALLAEDIINYKNAYVVANVGYSKVDSQKSDIFNSVVLDNSLDEDAYNFNLGLGYNYKELYFIEVNYQRIVLNNIDIDNFYINADYKFLNKSKFVPYVGILAGYSHLNWSTHPVRNVGTYNTNSSSMLLGLEAGVMYPISKQLFTEFTYQYMKTNHTTNIVKSAAISDVDHDSISSINIGIRYEF